MTPPESLRAFPLSISAVRERAGEGCDTLGVGLRGRPGPFLGVPELDRAELTIEALGQQLKTTHHP